MMKTLKYITSCSTLFLFAALLLVSVSCDDDDTKVTLMKLQTMHVNNTANGMVTLIEGDSWTPAITVYTDGEEDHEESLYRYSSSNESIFTVNETGVVTAAGIGEATLTVWSPNNTDIWASCVIKVEKRIYPVTNIDIPVQYQNYYMGVESTFKLGETITVSPDNATTPEVLYRSSDNQIAEVNEYGEVYTKALGNVTITVVATDGSGVQATSNIYVRDADYSNLLDRTNWSVSLSHDYCPDAAVKGTPESLIDDDLLSCLVMVKPGKSLNGITVGADETVYFVIDMAAQQEFDFFKLRHRTNNTSANLRVTKVSVYGSNDGEEYTQLISGATIATAASVAEVTVSLPDKANYRYFKLTYDGWSSSGNSIQVSDFNIGSMKYLDLSTE